MELKTVDDVKKYLDTVNRSLIQVYLPEKDQTGELCDCKVLVKSSGSLDEAEMMDLIATLSKALVAQHIINNNKQEFVRH